jgi:hypothetical protein
VRGLACPSYSATGIVALRFNAREFRARCEYLMGDKRKACVAAANRLSESL